MLINVYRDEDDFNQSDGESMSNANADDGDEEAATVTDDEEAATVTNDEEATTTTDGEEATTTPNGQEAQEVDQTFEDVADTSSEGRNKKYR